MPLRKCMTLNKNYPCWHGSSPILLMKQFQNDIRFNDLVTLTLSHFYSWSCRGKRVFVKHCVPVATKSKTISGIKSKGKVIGHWTLSNHACQNNVSISTIVDRRTKTDGQDYINILSIIQSWGIKIIVSQVHVHLVIVDFVTLLVYYQISSLSIKQKYVKV